MWKPKGVCKQKCSGTLVWKVIIRKKMFHEKITRVFFKSFIYYVKVNNYN